MKKIISARHRPGPVSPASVAPSRFSVTVGLLQMTAAGGPAANLKKAVCGIEDAARRGAEIICLQELFLTRYFCQSEDRRCFRFAESVPGPTTKVLSKVAREKSVVLIVPLFEKRAEGIYHNSACVIDADGRLLGTYRKMHIPDDPHFYEKFYFTPGDSGFRNFRTRYGRIGVLICWDQWFPEAARISALGGAEIIFYPTAIGWQRRESHAAAEDQLSGWEIVQRGHAVANEVFVAVTNRVGQEGGITFWGSSFVADPFGKIVAQSGRRKEENLVVRCGLQKIENARQSWPFLRDRRIDAYGPISSRFLDG